MMPPVSQAGPEAEKRRWGIIVVARGAEGLLELSSRALPSVAVLRVRQDERAEETRVESRSRVERYVRSGLRSNYEDVP